MILALCVFAFIPKQVFSGDPPDLEVVKGQVVDLNGDGEWDCFYFSIETKNAKDDVFVKSVNVANVGDKVFSVAPTSRMEINKRIDEYRSDISDLELTGDIQVQIVLDISTLRKNDEIIDGGPGPNPNETIIIIKYP